MRKNETPLPSGMTLYSSVGETGISPAEFVLNPIRMSLFYQWDLDRDWNDVKARVYVPRVCPGTPLTVFSNWAELPRHRAELEIDGIRLADYQLNDTQDNAGGFGVMVP
jgi:hypothetical protein